MKNSVDTKGRPLKAEKHGTVRGGAGKGLSMKHLPAEQGAARQPMQRPGHEKRPFLP